MIAPSVARAVPPVAAAWLGFWAWWTLMALAYAHGYQVQSTYAPSGPMPWGEAARMGFADMYLWAATCLVAFLLAARLPLSGGRWRWSVPLHVVAALALLGLRMHAENLLAPLFPAVPAEPIAAKALRRWPGFLFAHGMQVGVGYAVVYFAAYRREALRAAGLELQLSRARLQVLKMQLQPHFLFNTLNSISALVHIDTRAADEMVERLEHLLRLVLEQAHTPEVTLREELAFLRPYLEIEQTRFRGRLRVEWQIDPGALDARVPHLILQPLVENAIKHAIARNTAAGFVEIRAEVAGGSLRLSVRDSGAGAEQAAHARPRHAAGVGLANTRERLRQMYDDRASFALSRAAAGGTTATITLPHQPARTATA